MTDLFSDNGATISKDQLYRYGLWRTWNPDKPKVCFICLNPSKADATLNDPTLIRLINFANYWNYGGLLLVNLFAYRSTDPHQLSQVDDPVGPENDSWIDHHARQARLVVFGWGAKGSIMGRDQVIIDRYPNGHCIELTAAGMPRHPLYLKKDLKPILMSLAQHVKPIQHSTGE